MFTSTKMTRTLNRRLERLEAQRARKTECPKLIVIFQSGEQRRSLSAGEHIVEDWYEEEDGCVLARERIATEPTDEGQRSIRQQSNSDPTPDRMEARSQ
jgi:hypothetical protein